METAATLAARVSLGDASADRELTRLAASGDLEAQRELLTILLGDPDEINARSFAEVAHIELLARFCAFRGHNLDVRRLAAILWQMARTAPDEAARSEFASQSIALLRALADDGDGLASEYLASLAADFPEEWAAAETECSSPPPSIVRVDCVEPTIGDILAAVLASSVVQEPPGFCARIRDFLTDWTWRFRFRLIALLEGSRS